jgi:Tfp pilus assembly protein PilX
VGKMEKNVFIKNPKTNRGIAIAFTLFSVVILMVLSLGIASIGITKARTTKNFLQTQRAYYLSRSGIIYGSNHIKERWLNEGYLGGPEGPLTRVINNNEKFVVEIWAHKDNMTSSRKLWKITSTGYANNAVKRLTAWMDMGTFAEYTYFSDIEAFPDSSPDQKIWFMGPELTGAPAVPQLRGKIHTNGFFNIFGRPIFEGSITTSNGDGKDAKSPVTGKDDPYWDPKTNSYNQEGTTTSNSSKFYHFKDSYTEDYPVGSNKDFSYAGGKNKVELPDNPEIVKNGANATYNKDIRVSFQDNGQVKVTPVDGSASEYLNTNLLTLYTTGKIIVDGGKLKGMVTLGSARDIEFRDSVVYVDKTRDVFGAVAGENIVIDTNPETVKDMEIHGSLMALQGAFYVKDHDIGVTRGTLSIFGGIINKYRGPIGNRRQTTNTKYDADGNIIEQTVTVTHSGYYRDYKGDSKLMNRPPPNFPGTSELKVVMIIDESAL